MADKVRVFTLLLGVVVAGSVMPDLDHILPPYARSWGHNPILPCAVLLGVALAYSGRHLLARFLGRSK